MSPLRIRHRLLSTVSRTGHRLGPRVTGPGGFVLGVVAVCAALGIDTHQTVAYQLFALGAALLAGAALGAWRGDRRLRGALTVEHLLPRQGSAGEPLGYRLRVRNASRRRLEGLELIERVPLELPSPEELGQALAELPGRAWPDRIWPRRVWAELLERRRMARLEPRPLPPLAAGAQVELRAELTPRHRGNLTFAGVLAARTEPLGLLRSLAPAFRSPVSGPGASTPAPGRPRADLRATVPVLPRRYPVGRLALPGRRTYQPGSHAFAASVGDSEEFVGLREYRPGDPLPRIHWASFARRGEPIVREFQEEFFERHALAVDTFAPVRDAPLVEAAISAAASLASAADTRESLLELVFVGTEAHRLTAGRGHLGEEHLLRALAGARRQPPSELDTLARALLDRAGELSSAVLVLVGLDAPRRALIERLQSRSVTVRALIIEPEDPGRAVTNPPPGAVVRRRGELAAGLNAL